MEKSPVRSDAVLPEWKPDLMVVKSLKETPVILELPKACYYLLCCYLMIHPDLTFILNVTDNRPFTPELHDPSTVALGIVSHSLLFVLSIMAFLKIVIDHEFI